MALAQVHAIAPVKIDPVGAVNSIVGGITRLSVSNNGTVVSQVESGEIYPYHVSLVQQSPRASFTTRDIRTALIASGITGLKITSDGSNPGFVAYFRKRDSVGPAAGGVHRSYTFSNGVLFPTSLSVQHRGNAEIAYDMLGVSPDGSTSSIVISDVASLPTEGAGTQDDAYALYKAVVNGVVATGVTGVDIDFGVSARTQGADGNTQDTVGFIAAAEPTITLRGLDLTWVKNSASLCDLLSETVGHANTNIVFKNRGSAIANAVHVNITANGLAYAEQLADGSGDSEGTVNITIKCVHDGTNAPLVLNTAYNEV